MFSYWIVNVLRFTAQNILPKFNFSSIFLAAVTNTFYVVILVLLLNRQLRRNYINCVFSNQVLCFAKLFSVAYALRFVLVEMVYCEKQIFDTYFGDAFNNFNIFNDIRVNHNIKEFFKLVLYFFLIATNFFIFDFIETLILSIFAVATSEYVIDQRQRQQKSKKCKEEKIKRSMNKRWCLTRECLKS